MTYKLIEASNISGFCRYFAKSSTIAVDTEFSRINSYWPKLALIQISDGQETVLIDPLEQGMDLTPLQELLTRTDSVKVFHSCRQDLEVLFRLFGELPNHIFDTQLAYTFLYPVDEVSLAKMLEEQLGIVLNKAKQNANWMRRPLPASQLTYAANDVAHLPEIKEILLEKLKSLGRYDWFKEDQVTEFAPHMLAPTTGYWLRLAKRGNHKSQQLYILKSLCDWREMVAQELNYNRKRVLSDETILKIAEHKDLNVVQELEIPSVCRDSFALLWDQVMSAPEDQWPRRLKRKPMTLQEQTYLERLRALLDTVATDLNVSQKLIATTDDLKSHIHKTREVAFLKGWRYEVFGRFANNI